MKILTTVFATAITIFSMQHAAAQTPKPAYCPPPLAIKFASIDKIEKGSDGSWGMGIESQFGTNSKWIFALFGIQAKDEAEAGIKGRLLLQTLKFFAGPVEGPMNETWSCFYFALGHPALAVNGLSNINFNVLKGTLK